MTIYESMLNEVRAILRVWRAHRTRWSPTAVRRVASDLGVSDARSQTLIAVADPSARIQEGEDGS